MPAAMGIDAPFVDDYSSYILTNYSNPPNSFFSLDNQNNPDGFSITSKPWLGAATDAVMQNIPAGAPGGVPPVGNLRSTGLPPGPYAALARRTGQDQSQIFTPGLQFRFTNRTISQSQPMALTNDWYLQSAGTSQWWSPVSFVAGGTPDRVFFGGTHIGGVFTPFENQSGVLDTFVSLGAFPGDSNFEYGFYAPPRDPAVPFPVGQWFELMEMFTASLDGQSGRSLWIKTQDTVANGFLDPRMASGDLVPTDNNPAGWLNIFPGIADDPNTSEREGVGLAHNQYGQEAPTRGHLGQAVSPSYWAVLNVAQYGAGLDPPAFVAPDFQPDDAFLDNTTFAGAFAIIPDVVPDHLIPFFDDFELYPATLPLVTIRLPWYDTGDAFSFVASGAQGQSLIEANQLNFGVLKTEKLLPLSSPDLPVVAAFGAPMVARATLRLSSSPGATTRTVKLDPATLNIVLGGVDPTVGADAADNMVWIDQPNPNFNPNSEWQDHLVQRHWIPSDMWQTPPADAPLNTRHTLVPTGVIVPLDTDFELRLEVEPDSPSSTANQLRVFIAGNEVFPNGDSSQRFVAPDRAAASLVFGTGTNKAGAGDTFVIDDVSFDGPLFAPAAGPAFALPYVDDFESYPANETIDGQGSTPFLASSSVYGEPSIANLRHLTILQDPSAVPAQSELVCRYLIDDVFLGSGLLTPGEIVAVSFADLPAQYDTTISFLSGCPGDLFNPTSYVMRPGFNRPRLETGNWSLQAGPPDEHNTPSTVPTPFDPALGDTTGFRFDFFTDARFTVVGDNNAMRIRPLGEALPGQGGAGDNILEIRSVVPGKQDLIHQLVLPPPSSLNSFLPTARATADMGFAQPGQSAQLAFDIYIESLDANGTPDDTLAPRSRLAIPLVGADGAGGRLTTLMLGGPHVNEDPDLQNENPPVEILPTDAISVAVVHTTSSHGLPSSIFQDTGVSLITGGAGLDGALAGPLVNRWIRIFASVDVDSMWTIRIDEDRDGPLEPVTIATNAALDLGLSDDGTLLDTSSLDQFTINLGLDLGSGGEPAPRTARVVGFAGGPVAQAPTNADPVDDWCYYTISQLDFIDDLNPLLIAQVDPSTGEVTSTEALSASFNVVTLAVLNRRRDGANQVVGPKVHTHCPWDIAAAGKEFDASNLGGYVNQFDFFDPASGQRQVGGTWTQLGQIGEPGSRSPIPAGGVSVPDGPSQTPPIAYNDPTQAPLTHPGAPLYRDILLAEWAADASDGWDAIPPAFPQERWLVDNVELSAVSTGPNCANLAGDPTVVDGADLATLLVNWGPATVGALGDLNDDGTVDGADLAILLVNWGSCP